MIIANLLDKRLSNKYKNLNMTKLPSTSCEEKRIKEIDLLAYKRIYEYNIKKEFYSYITKQFYYALARKELSKYLQHGNTNIMRHCRNVAYLSFVCAKMLEKKFGFKFDYKALVIGAYLHDLFMYDWHEKNGEHRLHGFSHPKIASKNAKRLCNITQKEQSIIESHMWPLTITKIPKSKEAFLVCLIDKHSALIETFAWKLLLLKKIFQFR